MEEPFPKITKEANRSFYGYMALIRLRDARAKEYMATSGSTLIEAMMEMKRQAKNNIAPDFSRKEIIAAAHGVCTPVELVDAVIEDIETMQKVTRENRTMRHDGL